MKRPYLVTPEDVAKAAVVDANTSAISPIEDIIEDARNGRPYILVDAEDRENEGDVIIPAQFATPDLRPRPDLSFEYSRKGATTAPSPYGG